MFRIAFLGGTAMHDMHDMHTMDHKQPEHCDPSAPSQITEYPLAWPGAAQVHTGPACHPTGGGSTHEITYDRAANSDHFWVSGQNYNHIARIDLHGNASFFAMPTDKGNSLPHGLTYDQQGRLWVTFEGLGQLARIDEDGSIAETVDVCMKVQGAPAPMNTRPHGLGCASDGALWFTGKLSNTVGRVHAGQVQHFQLPTIGAVPIYLAADSDGGMWCTELTGNMVAHIARTGEVNEIAIPTGNSRPIAVTRAPDGTMWFTEEAGCKVGRVDAGGKTITEFAVPATDHGSILGALAFDKHGALWVQMYVNPPAAPAKDVAPYPPTASDYIVRIGTEILTAPAGDLTGVSIEYFKAPSKGTVMHRIIQGPDGNIWFTELGLNQVGKLALEHC